jgi:hypothetical protein
MMQTIEVEPARRRREFPAPRGETRMRSRPADRSVAMLRVVAAARVRLFQPRIVAGLTTGAVKG